jgi:F-type H+-transporting ATPase subunit delta
VSSQTKGATGLEGRYASALFELAGTETLLTQVDKDLAAFDSLIQENEDLNNLIRSPIISRDEQGAALRAILVKAGVNDLTQRFIGLVAQKRRLFALRDIIRAFQALLAAHRGETTAEVTSARELSDEQMKALGASLKDVVGSDVTVDATVDPDLLGGLIVKVGSRMIDTSLKTKLQQLRLAMSGPRLGV